MLVVNTKKGEPLYMGDVAVSVLRVNTPADGNEPTFRVGVEAPPRIQVLRKSAKSSVDKHGERFTEKKVLAIIKDIVEYVLQMELRPTMVMAQFAPSREQHVIEFMVARRFRFRDVIVWDATVEGLADLVWERVKHEKTPHK